ncbi:hypothetical protein RSAG8_00582, partial [Rhizoctonia solani AG-8 WAC10335]
MQAVNEYDEALEGIKWGTDYLVNCISSPDQFVGQLGISAIGETDIDFGYFGPAEEYEMWAPRGIKRSDGIAYINSTNPSSEILGESAAALAAASVVFAKHDKDYSEKLRGHAVDLYTRAATHQGSYMKSTHPNLQTLKSWYPSTIFEDELAWAAAWLYVATGDEQWRRTADEWIVKAGSHLGEYSWDEKLPGAHMLLFLQTKNETYKAGVEQYFTNFGPNGSVKQTAKGLSFYYGWGSLRSIRCGGKIMERKGKTFCSRQLSTGSFSTVSLRAIRLGTNSNYDVGALEGGPAWNDTFKDDRSAYEYTEVTQDYNAAFTGLNAAMIDFYGHSKFKAFTDCGLDLGWSHPNASNPPQWPDNDCYHTCNTNCVKTAPVDENNTGNSTNPEPTGSTGAGMPGATVQGLTTALFISSILGALTLL